MDENDKVKRLKELKSEDLEDFDRLVENLCEESLIVGNSISPRTVFDLDNIIRSFEETYAGAIKK